MVINILGHFLHDLQQKLAGIKKAVVSLPPLPS